jgi:manganese transport protein
MSKSINEPALRHAPPVRQRRLFALFGPAVMASVAYMDPGNFATNIEAGAKYGYSLLWIVFIANLIGMLFQTIAARLGFVTGLNLAEHCRRELPSPAARSMWLLCELAAIATELAELIGAALGIQLLCGLPLLAGMLVTVVVVSVLLDLERRGVRLLELAIAGFVGIIGLCYLLELLVVPIAWPTLLAQGVPTRMPHGEALLLAAGIVGATVMPHALFLHSGLTQHRFDARDARELRGVLRFSTFEVMFALGAAGLINLAMVMMAAGAFHQNFSHIASIDTAYLTLGPLLGSTAAALFIIALIAAGISSSVVGTLAGQMIMQGFVTRRIPVGLRRLVTIAPSFAIIACGVDATRALIVSQVVLSLALPVPMFMLIWLTSRQRIMGAYRNRLTTLALALTAVLFVTALNAVLVWQAIRAMAA